MNRYALRKSLLPSRSATRLFAFGLALALLSGCAPKPTPMPVLLATAALTATPEPSETVAPVSVPTATFTATATATETPAPTNTAIPALAVVQEQSAAWCLPIDYAFPAAEAPITNVAPAGARAGSMQDGTLNIQIPAISCTLVFAFNQPVPAGTRIEIAYVLAPNSPWMSTDLTPAADNPALASITIKHEYVVNPPYWEITFPVTVRGPDGSVLWNAPVRFFKALPNPCWDGSLPDPVTLYCKNYDGDWNYDDFPNFNPTADIFK